MLPSFPLPHPTIQTNTKLLKIKQWKTIKKKDKNKTMENKYNTRKSMAMLQLNQTKLCRQKKQKNENTRSRNHLYCNVLSFLLLFFVARERNWGE